MTNAPYIVDARPLISAFSETDARVPGIVFSLLDLFLVEGPFEFDAAALSTRLSDTALKIRLNPEEIAALQPTLERFFEETDAGWTPRRGVLAS